MVHFLIFRVQEINVMVFETAAQKDEKIFNPIGNAETQYVLIKFGSSLYIVYCHGEMTQFVRDDAAAAKVLPRRLHSGVQLNRSALLIAQLCADFLKGLAAMDLKPHMTEAALC